MAVVLRRRFEVVPPLWGLRALCAEERSSPHAPQWQCGCGREVGGGSSCTPPTARCTRRARRRALPMPWRACWVRWASPRPPCLAPCCSIEKGGIDSKVLPAAERDARNTEEGAGAAARWRVSGVKRRRSERLGAAKTCIVLTAPRYCRQRPPRRPPRPLRRPPGPCQHAPQAPTRAAPHTQHEHLVAAQGPCCKQHNKRPRSCHADQSAKGSATLTSTVPSTTESSRSRPRTPTVKLTPSRPAAAGPSTSTPSAPPPNRLVRTLSTEKRPP